MEGEWGCVCGVGGLVTSDSYGPELLTPTNISCRQGYIYHRDSISRWPCMSQILIWSKRRSEKNQTLLIPSHLGLCVSSLVPIESHCSQRGKKEVIELSKSPLERHKKHWQNNTLCSVEIFSNFEVLASNFLSKVLNWLSSFASIDLSFVLVSPEIDLLKELVIFSSRFFTSSVTDCLRVEFV